MGELVGETGSSKTDESAVVQDAASPLLKDTKTLATSDTNHDADQRNEAVATTSSTLDADESPAFAKKDERIQSEVRGSVASTPHADEAPAAYMFCSTVFQSEARAIASSTLNADKAPAAAKKEEPESQQARDDDDDDYEELAELGIVAADKAP